MKIQVVSTLELDELTPYRTLKRPLEHVRKGIFVAEGEKVVRRLLESGLDVISLLLTPAWLGRLQASGHLKDGGEPDIFLASEAQLCSIVGFRIHQGIMAVSRVPAPGSLDRLPAPHFLVALDGLRISENVGVIVRNCVAFGVDAILAGETSCSPYVRRAVRNSMGAVFKIPVILSPCLAETLAELKHRFGTRIISADPQAATTIYDMPLTGNLCIVLGNEDEGVSADVSAAATHRAVIPMCNQTDSLNVGSASAVFLYEASRQRSMAGAQA